MLEKLVEDYHYYKIRQEILDMNVVLGRILKGTHGIQYIMEQRHLVWVKDPATITEICHDTLLICLEQYIPNYGKFFTYYVTCCHRAMLSLMTKQHRNPIYESQFMEYENEGSTFSEQDLIACPQSQEPFIETEQDIDNGILKRRLSALLNNREFDVCCLILDTPYKLKNKDISNMLGLSTSTVSQIFAKLRSKLSPDFFSII